MPRGSAPAPGKAVAIRQREVGPDEVARLGRAVRLPLVCVVRVEALQR